MNPREIASLITEDPDIFSESGRPGPGSHVTRIYEEFYDPDYLHSSWVEDGQWIHGIIVPHALELLAAVPSEQLEKLLRKIRRTKGFRGERKPGKPPFLGLLQRIKAKDILSLRRINPKLFFLLKREMISDNPEMEEKFAQFSEPKQKAGSSSLVSPRKQTAISLK